MTKDEFKEYLPFANFEDIFYTKTTAYKVTGTPADIKAEDASVSLESIFSPVEYVTLSRKNCKEFTSISILDGRSQAVIAVIQKDIQLIRDALVTAGSSV